MEILHRATTVTASVRALPEIATARGQWSTVAPARLRDLVKPTRALAYGGLGTSMCGTPAPLDVSSLVDLRAHDNKFSTRLGLSAGPPV